MSRTRKIAAAALSVLALSITPCAALAAPDEDQGFLKKQGPSGGAGQGECSTAGQQELPAGQAKKCSHPR
ncbi:MAG TPA: hypothetical protein VK387_06225 [Thermoleophilaceae bacterium]|nr:hypothetical protein [Thermoleophilaceae bacterium]